jgi:hypothetical protein
MPSTHQRLLLFIYSNANIVASCLGLLGLGLFFSGVIHKYWYWIVAGLYTIGLVITPKGPQFDLRLRSQFSVAEIDTGLERLVCSVHGKVSKDVFAKIQSITESIHSMLPRIVNLDSSDPDIYVIRQTALEYLPQSLQSYLKLPRAYAELHPLKGGRTACQLLLEQLDLLDEKMKQIVEDFHRNDTEQLIMHGRFLQEKFAPTYDWLDETERH